MYKKNQKRTTLLFLMTLFSLMTLAQIRTVKGVVKDASGEPIIGANATFQVR